jgi:DNA primase
VEGRGVTSATSEKLNLGFAPLGRDQLKRALLDQGYSQALLLRAGLVVQRDDGTVIDRFRNRLMIPICRDTGAVIAFGGRALEADQQPKYLNSPETPIYSKSRTLYGLNLAKAAIRQGGFAVMVEGYFDFAQVFQSGVQAVVASCGTALTTQQAQYLGRFAKKVVLSFDPDAAGRAPRSNRAKCLSRKALK